jgi:hypothetical protein
MPTRQWISKFQMKFHAIFIKIKNIKEYFRKEFFTTRAIFPANWLNKGTSHCYTFSSDMCILDTIYKRKHTYTVRYVIIDELRGAILCNI